LDLRDRDRLYALFEAILQYSRHFCIIRLANGESTSDVVRIEVSFEVKGSGSNSSILGMTTTRDDDDRRA